MLAFYPRQRHTREELIDMLWPDADLTAARNRLSQALVWLRLQLEPNGGTRGSVLTADRVHIGLNPIAMTTDVAEFEGLLKAARIEEDALLRRAFLTQAAALYQGPLLAGYYQDWVLGERQWLLDAYLVSLRELVSTLSSRYGSRYSPAKPFSLVTLIGPGGSGKTRLAAVTRLAETRPGGDAFAPLADLNSASMIASAIAFASSSGRPRRRGAGSDR